MAKIIKPLTATEVKNARPEDSPLLSVGDLTIVNLFQVNVQIFVLELIQQYRWLRLVLNVMNLRRYWLRISIRVSI